MIRWLMSFWYRLIGRHVCALCRAPAPEWVRFQIIGFDHDDRPIRACAECRTVKLVARSARRLSL